MIWCHKCFRPLHSSKNKDSRWRIQWCFKIIISSILLEKNGCMCSSKQTKFMNVLYYVVMDWVERGDIEIIYCPSEQMVADFFTKSLQGTLFRRILNLIMNCKDGLEPESPQAQGVCWRWMGLNPLARLNPFPRLTVLMSANVALSQHWVTRMPWWVEGWVLHHRLTLYL